MKKTLFLSAILGAALCSSAFAEETTATVSGNNNRELNLNSAPYQNVDKVIFDQTADGTNNFFTSGAQTYSQAIQIGNGTDSQGMMINNGYGNVVTFTGKVTGTGTFQKTGAGTGLNIVFAGDATDYEGAINLSANASATFTLRFGGDDVTAVATTETKGVSGTGTISFKNGGANTLEYKYNAAETPVYITNAIATTAGTSHVKLGGGADYVMTEASTISDLALRDGSDLTLNDTINGTLRNYGTSAVTLNGSNYSNLEIRAYDNETTTLTVTGQDADLTIKQIIQDPSDGTHGHIDVVLDNGHKTSISNWVTVDSVTLKNGSSVYMNNHTVGTLTVASGSTSMITGGAGIGTNQHKVNNIVVEEGASLTTGAANATVQTLTMAEGASLTVGDGDTHNLNLTTTSLTVNGDGAMTGNLVVANKGTMTFADGAALTMGGNVTIGNTVTVMLTDTMVESIQAGNWVEIFSGVTTANLSQSLTFSGSGIMSDYVAEHEAVYSLKQVGDKVYITPEPATATLSLLALAALAARRRRH